MNFPPFPWSGVPVSFRDRADLRYGIPIRSQPVTFPSSPVWGYPGVSTSPSYAPFQGVSPPVPHPHLQNRPPSPSLTKEEEVSPTYRPLWDSPESPESPWLRI